MLSIFGWLIGSTIGRLVLGAGGMLVIGLMAWGYIKLNYVPKAEYEILRRSLEYHKEVIVEKDEALQKDAEQAMKDAAEIESLERQIHEHQIHGDNPVVVDDDDAEWLQNLAR